MEDRVFSVIWKEDGEIYKARRFKDFRKDEHRLITFSPYLWEGDEIFVLIDGQWKYKYDEELDIIEVA